MYFSETSSPTTVKADCGTIGEYLRRRQAYVDRSAVFTQQVGIAVPLICGAMYPCSNPELVAAVSEAGGIGIVQPISMVYVHGYELQQGLRRIRALTDKPIGFNALVEKATLAQER